MTLVKFLGFNELVSKLLFLRTSIYSVSQIQETTQYVSAFLQVHLHFLQVSFTFH